MAQIYGKRLKYIRNGFTMLEISKNLTNGVNIWEKTHICGKFLK